MKLRLFFAIILSIWLSQKKAIGQYLVFNLSFDNQSFRLGENYFSKTWNDSFSISTIRFYISNISLIKSNQIIYKFPQKEYLVDFENQQNISIPFTNTNSYDAIRFSIGIDSVTNVNSEMSGDLDPIYGMYWTWQSGFINWKIEGNSPSISTRNHLFQYHIGGFRNPYNTLQTIQLPFLSSSKNIKISLSLEQLLNSEEIKDTFEMMSPGEKALKLSQLFKNVFVIKNEN